MSKMSKFMFRLIDLIVIFVMTFGSPLAALAAPSLTGATIASDLPDYPMGAIVTLTGAGWAPGEAVNLFVNDNVFNSWSHSGNIAADENGAFTYQFQLPNWFVATYTAAATGPSSGTATTTFTDSPPA